MTSVAVKVGLGGSDVAVGRYEFDGSLGGLSGALEECAKCVNEIITEQMVKQGNKPPGKKP